METTGVTEWTISTESRIKTPKVWGPVVQEESQQRTEVNMSVYTSCQRPPCVHLVERNNEIRKVNPLLYRCGRITRADGGEVLSLINGQPGTCVSRTSRVPRWYRK